VKIRFDAHIGFKSLLAAMANGLSQKDSRNLGDEVKCDPRLRLDSDDRLASSVPNQNTSHPNPDAPDG
jgi:hypothetical protein